MPANTEPIVSKLGSFQSPAGVVVGPSANTAQDGTGANIYVAWQAPSSFGGFLRSIILRSAGSPATTVARFYIHTTTGAFTPGTTNTAANTALIGEATLTTTTLSQTAAAPHYEYPMNMAIQASYRVLVSFGTSTGAAGTGYVISGVGGEY
jgi:hypothetical protein